MVSQDPPLYRYLDAVIVRAAVWDPARAGAWPDLTGPGAGPASWAPWLRQTMQFPGFAMALELASPVLAGRVHEICDGRELPESSARSVVLSVMRYRLRASGRATPFGLFAGVAPARIGPKAAFRAGAAHRVAARVDARWLAAVIDCLEAEPALRPRLMVLANDLAFERDGYLVLEHRPSLAAGSPPAHVRARGTRPAQAAMTLTHRPIQMSELAAKLAGMFAGIPALLADRLLADLVAQRFLLTNLRPSMTVTHPLDYLIGELQAAAAWEIPRVADVLSGLSDVADALRRVQAAAGPDNMRRQQARSTAAMARVLPAPAPRIALDMRADMDVVVPDAVAAEAARAAGVLVRLAPRPGLSAGWVAWHQHFLERYGPRALVPVLEAVEDTEIGYPAGYLGAAPPPARVLTDRDAKLLALAQRAALRHLTEVLLDEAMIADLAGPRQAGRVQPSAELTVRVCATSARSASEENFTLMVVGVSRAAGTTAGRFLHLLGDEDRQRMTSAYVSLPAANRDALGVQISAPTLYADADNVACSPQVLGRVLHLGEYRHDSVLPRAALEDIAITADADQLYLISLSRRRVLEPMFNAVELGRRVHPLVRFLAEAPNALSRPCACFDWGAAAGLPFLPALRYGRTILSPARWLLKAADLPGPAASWQEWDDALTRWQRAVALTKAIYLGENDQRIGLDLSEPAHRALVRAELDRAGSAVARAAPDADAAGWTGGYVHEIVIPVAAAVPAPDPPARTRRGSEVIVSRDHGHLPGCHDRIYLKLYGHPGRYDSILARHLPRLLDELGDQAEWWFLRYRDPDDHLRLRVVVPGNEFCSAAARIGAWTRRLRQAGLLSRAQWDTYFPETARFGGVGAIGAAESFFAADSAAAVGQLSACARKGGPDPAALISASMLDIAVGLLGDTGEAMNWLITRTRAAVPAPSRTVYHQAIALASPGDHHDLAALPGGELVVSCWARRQQALAAYRAALPADTTARCVVLPDLLHLHHVRAAGPGVPDERRCLHLARAAAISWTARARKR